jgi:hypothetical protein
MTPRPYAVAEDKKLPAPYYWIRMSFQLKQSKLMLLWLKIP